MTTTIMTRAVARVTESATNPEYACGQCGTWHAGACPAAAHHQLGTLLTRMVREADARIPGGRRARRTFQEMAPGYTRRPLLTLHRPVMVDDACPLCGRWSCTGSDCPPGAAPAPATASGKWQCDTCGGWFGVTGVRPAPATAWTCDVCRAIGR